MSLTLDVLTIPRIMRNVLKRVDELGSGDHIVLVRLPNSFPYGESLRMRWPGEIIKNEKGTCFLVLHVVRIPGKGTFVTTTPRSVEERELHPALRRVPYGKAGFIAMHLALSYYSTESAPMDMRHKVWKTLRFLASKKLIYMKETKTAPYTPFISSARVHLYIPESDKLIQNVSGYTIDYYASGPVRVLVPHQTYVVGRKGLEVGEEKITREVFVHGIRPVRRNVRSTHSG